MPELTHLPRKAALRGAILNPEKTLFLDIETTGLSIFYDSITLVGWSIEKKYGVFIKGGKDKALRKVLKEAKTIVTFNGTSFDIPMLKREFPGLSIPACHLDLRFLAKRAGMPGGQKRIERLLGMKRPKNVSGIEGRIAPLLWQKYCLGDVAALKRLISYNHADVEGMKVILDEVAERILKESAAWRFSENRSKIDWQDITLLYPFKWPLATLRDLVTGKKIPRIVGIDLSGSKKRPSGWCLLEGEVAITKRLFSDAEIIKETIASRPDIISIDSPLSIPENGIMRQCERILRKRGINVYPPMIASMQDLTLRGISLAGYFRGLSIPAIESYPGAAQDILGIPRKRADRELLARGLERFGVKGDFIKNPVSDDELDAITSAVVGAFFLSEKAEAIGNKKEGYLIIPDIKTLIKTLREKRRPA